MSLLHGPDDRESGISMLLRRITKHVKDQNWFAVALDFFIVVIGVFIGIQVANWNESLGDRRQEAAIVERLDEEFLTIQETARARAIRAEQTVENTQNMLALLAVGDLPEDFDTFASLIDGTRAFQAPPPTSSTLNQLIASGDMSLLESDVLRNALTDFNAALELHLRDDQLNIQVAINHGAEYWRFSELSAAAAGMNDMVLQQRVYDAATSPDLVPALAAILRQQRDVASSQNATLLVIDEVVASLDDEISP